MLKKKNIDISLFESISIFLSSMLFHSYLAPFLTLMIWRGKNAILQACISIFMMPYTYARNNFTLYLMTHFHPCDWNLISINSLTSKFNSLKNKCRTSFSLIRACAETLRGERLAQRLPDWTGRIILLLFHFFRREMQRLMRISLSSYAVFKSRATLPFFKVLSSHRQ